MTTAFKKKGPPSGALYLFLTPTEFAVFTYKARVTDTSTSQSLNIPVKVECVNPLPKKDGGNKKKEQKMYDDFEDERSYLSDRYSEILYREKHKLRKQFFLDDDETPTTMKQFVQRILDGKYVLSKRAIKASETVKDGDDSFYYDPWNICRSISFRDPKNLADEEGYEKAFKLLEKKLQPAYDAINVLDPKDALAKLQEIEATLS
jgi:hypothetical protein